MLEFPFTTKENIEEGSEFQSNFKQNRQQLRSHFFLHNNDALEHFHQTSSTKLSTFR